MSKFNEHILVVLRWLQNPDLVTKKELDSNYNAADAYYARAAADAAAACAVADAAAACAAVCAAANAGDASYAATAAHSTSNSNSEYWLIVAKRRLDKYFELSGEDKGAYEERAKYLNILGVSNG